MSLPSGVWTAAPPACSDCGRDLLPIWFGSPQARPPFGGLHGGQVAHAGAPSHACEQCHRYAGQDGGPYDGSQDPLGLW